MTHPVHTPRINNNDDEVRLSAVLVEVGDEVERGQEIAEVETDKASFTVEAGRGGFVLKIEHQVEETVPVGSVLLWLGDSAGETPPTQTAETAGPGAATGATAKARVLLEEHGLTPNEVRSSGDRLTVKDVEAHLAARQAGSLGYSLPSGRRVALSMEERGMLRSVEWHRKEAVPAYLEIKFDPGPWEEYSAAYAERRRLLGDPLLPLMAHRLSQIAKGHGTINSTIVDGQKYSYDQVNLGYTIQVGATLYLVVVTGAGFLDSREFVKQLDKLHRRAIGHKLAPEELQGATVGFTSMSRWRVDRHIPILPPHVSIMVAHTVTAGGEAILGATYDHRVLSGADTIAVLREMVEAPES